MFLCETTNVNLNSLTKHHFQYYSCLISLLLLRLHLEHLLDGLGDAGRVDAEHLEELLRLPAARHGPHRQVAQRHVALRRESAAHRLPDPACGRAARAASSERYWWQRVAHQTKQNSAFVVFWPEKMRDFTTPHRIVLELGYLLSTHTHTQKEKSKHHTQKYAHSTQARSQQTTGTQPPPPPPTHRHPHRRELARARAERERTLRVVVLDDNDAPARLLDARRDGGAVERLHGERVDDAHVDARRGELVRRLERLDERDAGADHRHLVRVALTHDLKPAREARWRCAHSLSTLHLECSAATARQRSPALCRRRTRGRCCRRRAGFPWWSAGNTCRACWRRARRRAPSTRHLTGRRRCIRGWRGTSPGPRAPSVKGRPHLHKQEMRFTKQRPFSGKIVLTCWHKINLTGESK